MEPSFDYIKCIALPVMKRGDCVYLPTSVLDFLEVALEVTLDFRENSVIDVCCFSSSTGDL